MTDSLRLLGALYGCQYYAVGGWGVSPYLILNITPDTAALYRCPGLDSNFARRTFLQSKI